MLSIISKYTFSKIPVVIMGWIVLIASGTVVLLVAAVIAKKQRTGALHISISILAGVQNNFFIR